MPRLLKRWYVWLGLVLFLGFAASAALVLANPSRLTQESYDRIQKGMSEEEIKGILGEPDSELQDLLAAVDAVQQAARKPIRHGARGGDIFVAAEELMNASPHRGCLEFIAHGMGLISHEAPRLATNRAYSGYDADRALQSGMVVSIETTMKHPSRGFIKLEDTVAVTPSGHEIFGEGGRGWNLGGGAL